MKEELKQEQNVSQNDASKPEQNGSSEKYKAAEYIVAGLAIGFILAITGFFLWNNFQKSGNMFGSQKGSESGVPEKESALPGGNPSGLPETGDAPKESAKKAELDCGDWKKYTNSKAGYSICHPKDWTVEETDQYSSVTSGTVRYINVFSPGEKFHLYIGFKKIGENFAIIDRTGIGAGDSQKIDEITVLGKKMSVDGHYFRGEIREIFFNWSEPKWKSELYEIEAYFAKKGDSYDPGKGIKKDEPALTDAKKILASIYAIDDANGGCASNFTDSEKNIMENWKTYNDEKNKFSFMYPKDQTISKIDEDVINVNNKDGSTSFSIRSNAMAAADFYGYKISNESLVQVDCHKATRLVLATDLGEFPKAEQRKMISTQIDREQTRQRLEMNFPNLMSASLESDYFELYDMVLKSIKFVK